MPPYPCYEEASRIIRELYGKLLPFGGGKERGRCFLRVVNSTSVSGIDDWDKYHSGDLGWARSEFL